MIVSQYVPCTKATRPRTVTKNMLPLIADTRTTSFKIDCAGLLLCNGALEKVIARADTNGIIAGSKRLNVLHDPMCASTFPQTPFSLHRPRHRRLRPFHP